MFCRRTQPVLVLHERTSRLTLAAKLAGKSAAETAATLMAIFKRLAPELKSSITFDNGSEFARHGLLASVSGMTTWFCDAYASWQKGSVENTNGRLRRQLPQASRPRHLEPGRPPGDRPLAQPHAPKVPRLSHPDPGLLQRPWQGHRDPVCLISTPLRLESRNPPRPIQDPKLPS